MTTTFLDTLGTALLFAPLLACAAQPATEVATRHGKVELVQDVDAVQLLAAGKRIATLDARSATLVAYAATREPDQPDYVVVQTMRADPACRHAYLMLALSEQGATLSKQFGRCLELAGSGMSGGEPVLHLSKPGEPQAAVETYRWHGGEAELVAESPSLCSATGFLARKNAESLSVPLAGRVAGSGRLQFLSAPDRACAMPGVFVVPGDSLTISLATDGYVYADYTNPKSGRKVQGWVARARLAPQ
jgi:hypothetical protein